MLPWQHEAGNLNSDQLHDKDKQHYFYIFRFPSILSTPEFVEVVPEEVLFASCTMEPVPLCSWDSPPPEPISWRDPCLRWENRVGWAVDFVIDGEVMVARGLVNWVLAVGMDALVGGDVVVCLPGIRNVAERVTWGLTTEDCTKAMAIGHNRG